MSKKDNPCNSTYDFKDNYLNTEKFKNVSSIKYLNKKLLFININNNEKEELFINSDSISNFKSNHNKLVYDNKNEVNIFIGSNNSVIKNDFTINDANISARQLVIQIVNNECFIKEFKKSQNFFVKINKKIEISKFKTFKIGNYLIKLVLDYNLKFKHSNNSDICYYSKSSKYLDQLNINSKKYNSNNNICNYKLTIIVYKKNNNLFSNLNLQDIFYFNYKDNNDNKIIKIGRSSKCNIVLKDDKIVSKIHCR